MEFDNSFEVPLPPAQAWKVLLDVERIAPCMPGAELTEIVDPETFKGKVSVRLGPVALTFQGQAKFEEIDEANRAAKVNAQGTDTKGRGGANAKVDFNLEPAGAGSKVLIHTDLQLSGSVAQYGRGVGMIQDLASHLIGQFADNLRSQIEQSGEAPVAAGEDEAAATASVKAEAAPAEQAQPSQPAAAKPISGFSLMLRVLWDKIVRMVKGSSSRA